jgi:sodium-independent sulfate anion transporter 11
MGDIGRSLAKSLGIKHDLESEDSVKWTAQLIDPPFEAYIEKDPTVGQYVKAHLPTKSGTAGYLRSLFPFLSWIFHYNATWLISDAIAGITVGFVVVPQGMAYALLAKLSPEYGLYTSFIAGCIYWMFATSKDITIGVCALTPFVGLTNTEPR